MRELLDGAGISSGVDASRGFDHGMFAPMAVIYPEADVPVLQMSLRTGSTRGSISPPDARWPRCATRAC